MKQMKTFLWMLLSSSLLLHIQVNSGENRIHLNKRFMRRMIGGIITCFLLLFSGMIHADRPDSVYLFPYPTQNNQGRGGMQLAWSTDGEDWYRVAEGATFVKCDFGILKQMHKPYMMQSRKDGKYHFYWYLDKEETALAYTSSYDLIRWQPQTYFMKEDKEKFEPEDYLQPIAKTVRIYGDEVEGWALKVPMTIVETLEHYQAYRVCKGQLRNERITYDATRFADLQKVYVRLTVNEEKAKPISNALIGVFFEDLNFAADGGLYAELIQNRDFEYSRSDGNSDENWNSQYAWSIKGQGMSFCIDTVQPIHPNNSHYAVLTVQQPGASLVNTGFDGIAIKKGEKYDLSVFTRSMNKKQGGKIHILLVSPEGKTLASAKLSVTSKDWKKQEVTLSARADEEQASLYIVPQSTGQYALDMISLFPRHTFKGRKNGLRADLAQAIADIHPRFVRFPGGCLAHGDGVDNIYHWKESIGPLESRKPAPNIWRYHQTKGLGYFELFQFCEDIGAEPLPVVAAGVSCQNSGLAGPSRHSHNLVTSQGQQGGIPMEEMGQYVQDVLDLIEYANGDARTTRWGRERAKAGHPEPFGLKYIGVGNEDLITDVFVERFTMIYEAIRNKYPEIVVIGTTGPFCEGTDYEAGWKLADQLKLPMVDEHNYNTPGWFINNQDYYDYYDRKKSKVYLGEYAAHLPGRPSNIETALSTALFLTAVERNGDVVHMTSYAPLLANEKHTQWRPDLIYFNNTEVKPTVDYYVQKMFGCNAGETYLPTQLEWDNPQKDVKKRVGVSVVKESVSGDYIVKLVNLLPAEVNTEVVIPALTGQSVQATCTVLSGQPTDASAIPVESRIDAGGQFVCKLSPYSFTVIRIPKIISQQ